MNHSFNTSVAEICGLEEAIILENIYFWCKKNEANNKLTENKPWTYNSVKAFNELFKYLTPAKITRALKTLEAEGFIEVGEFNQNAYDHTKWYCITNKTRSILENGNSICDFNKSNNDLTESNYTNSQITITDINTDNKPNNNLSPTSLNKEPPKFNPTKKVEKKRVTAEEKHKQYLSSLPSKINSLAEKCADKLISYLIKLQNSQTAATHKLAWQEVFARFIMSENKSESEIISIIDFAMTGWWSDKIFSADGIVKQYGKLYQQMNSDKLSQTKHQNSRDGVIDYGKQKDLYGII